MRAAADAAIPAIRQPGQAERDSKHPQSGEECDLRDATRRALPAQLGDFHLEADGQRVPRFGKRHDFASAAGKNQSQV